MLFESRARFRPMVDITENPWCLTYMRFKSISQHVRPYLMEPRRRTTINHAFAAAVAPSDSYNEIKVASAMTDLGQDSADDLICVYCGEPAETWDHVFATVKDSQFSGYGHRLGNLLPCCKLCNSKKGNKNWQQHLASISMDDSEKRRRFSTIDAYLKKYLVLDSIGQKSADYALLDDVRRNVLKLLKEGDLIAARIRAADATTLPDVCSLPLANFPNGH